LGVVADNKREHLTRYEMSFDDTRETFIVNIKTFIEKIGIVNS
jgi:hypothetical protein